MSATASLVSVEQVRAELEEARRQLHLLQQHKASTRLLGFALVQCAPASSEIDGSPSASREAELAIVAERLVRCVRKQDSLFQLEHGYFGILYRGVASTNHLELAAMQLERALDEPLYSVDERVDRRLRGALSGFNAQQSVGPLLKRVMDGVREARRTGAKLIRALETPAADPSQEIRLEDLEQALVEGELVPYFQPKVHCAYRNLVGAEALIRWHSPQRGLVPPDRFIPLLEGSDLVAPFTYQLFRQALSAMDRWPDRTPIAVNVPAILLNEPHLPVAIEDALALFRVDPAALCVEMTEASFVGDLEHTARSLQCIRDLGVRVSIDDFGTGYSSLSYLRDLPVDELKLDRSFICNLASNDKDKMLVGSVIDLAHGMSMKVVGEGIEDEATANVLKDLGCDVLQGYYFGKPMPSVEFSQWMLRRSA